jgi:hypothetical protein
MNKQARILTEKEVRNLLKDLLTNLRKKADRSSISTVLSLIKEIDVQGHTFNTMAEEGSEIEVLYENKDGSKTWLWTISGSTNINNKEQNSVILEKKVNNIIVVDETSHQLTTHS